MGDEADVGAGDGVGLGSGDAALGSGDAAVGPGSLVGVEGASMVLAQAMTTSNAEAIATTSNVTDRGLFI